MQQTCPIRYISAAGNSTAYHAIRKERTRAQIRAKVQAMLTIDHLTGTQHLTQQAAIGRVAEHYRHQRGFSPSKLTADYHLWQHGGQKQSAAGKPAGRVFGPRDWQLFCPNYTNGNQSAALKNPAFVDYIRTLFADTCRHDATGNALQQRLLDNWFNGDAIPGYGTIYQFCAATGRAVPTGPLARAYPDNYPAGWSPANLRRMLPASTATRTYLQRGEHAAHDHWGDQLLRDRATLMPLQLITFDDVRFDLKVIQPIPGGVDQLVYPEAIFCLDVATGLILSKGVLGAYTRTDDSDGGKKGTRRAFQHADMRWLMANLLEQYGLPVDWHMRVLLENASASMSEADQYAFEQATGIQFETTGLIRQKLTTSGFVEQGGMPWQKGWIEALFRAVHTRINHLPGTVGRRYDLTDGRQAAAEKYTLNTIKDAHEQGIPLDQLNLPILTIEQFHDLLDDYVTRLNWRTQHTLQGFNQVSEYEVSPGHYIRHDDPLAAQLIPVGAQLSRRMEAPAERFARLMHGHRPFDPVHPSQLRHLILDKRIITVRNERITLKITGQDDLIFRDTDTAHHLAEWNGRKKALIAYLATDQSCVHLFTNDGDRTYICTTAAVNRIDLTDDKAILKRSYEVHRGRQQVRHYAAELCDAREQQVATMRSHNDRILNRAAPVDPIADAIQTARKPAAKTHRMSDAEAAEFFDTTPAATTTEPDTLDPDDLF